MKPQQSTPHEALRAYQESNACLIDVRSSGEFQSVHAQGAVNLPLEAVDVKAVEQLAGQGRSVYLLCQTGGRAAQAYQRLLDCSFPIFVVEGGTSAWVREGLPIIGNKDSISLERQVRIAAGSLVLLGVVLSLLIPKALFLSAFVGAGLIFSGITDTCGMALLLAQMPWNRVHRTK